LMQAIAGLTAKTRIRHASDRNMAGPNRKGGQIGRGKSQFGVGVVVSQPFSECPRQAPIEMSSLWPQ
jgi:hypothetical protein